MIILLFLLPITDSIKPLHPGIGSYYDRFELGLLVENRYQIKDLTGGTVSLWGKGYRLAVDGYGLGPLKIYKVSGSHSTKITGKLVLGYGLSGHIYQFSDGNGHAAYGLDISLMYSDQLISIYASALDINKPKLTIIDGIDPTFLMSLSIGLNPKIHLEFEHSDASSLYTGFSFPITKATTVSFGFQNRPREFYFGLELNLKPKVIYSASIHEALGLSHRIGCKI